jgi:membrane-associated protein
MTGVAMATAIVRHRAPRGFGRMDKDRGPAPIRTAPRAARPRLCHDRLVRRSATAVTALLVPAALHLGHHGHGSPLDYIGVGAAAAASWAGVPGPGEPVLIGAGVLASKGKLDLTTVLVVAWLGATAGGFIGWVAGRRAGRQILTMRGPLRVLRLRAVQRGEHIFERYAVLAILLTPSWIAGIHRVRSSVYQPTNALAAAVWASAIGVGSYLAGPSVIDFVDDVGTGTTAIVAALLVAAVAVELVRRRRLRHRPQG